MARHLCYLLASCAVLIATAHSAKASVVLFDDFNNNDLATGGPGSVNGGIQLVENTVGTLPSLTEPVGTTANIATGDGFNNAGLVSINSFDPTSSPSFSATWVVDSQTGVGGGFNTTELLIQSSTAFRNDASARPWIEFRITSGGDWQIVADDGTSTSTLHNGGGLVGGVPDGYTVTMEFDQAGYSISATGFDANPNFSEAWDSNFDYSDFGSSMHIAATIQNNNVGSGKVLNVDSIQVDLVTTIPEPSSCLLAVFGLMAMCAATRKRRRLDVADV